MNPADDTFDRFTGGTDTEIRMLGRYIHAAEMGIERIRDEQTAELERQKATLRGDFEHYESDAGRRAVVRSLLGHPRFTKFANKEDRSGPT